MNEGSEYLELLSALGKPSGPSAGQHFLVDDEVLDVIGERVCQERPEVAYEVGAGVGQVTEQLAPCCGKVVAVELDRELFEIARRRLADLDEVFLLHGDFLEVDMQDGASVVGSPPFGISTELMEKTVVEGVEWWLMVLQRDFVDRLTEGAGSTDRDAVGSLTQFFYDVHLVRDVPRTSFYPEPEVDAVLVEGRKTPRDVDDYARESLVDFLRRIFAEGRLRKTRNLSLYRDFELEFDEKRVFELEGNELFQLFQEHRRRVG